jgi:hypothetical protein
MMLKTEKIYLRQLPASTLVVLLLLSLLLNQIEFSSSFSPCTLPKDLLYLGLIGNGIHCGGRLLTLHSIERQSPLEICRRLENKSFLNSNEKETQVKRRKQAPGDHCRHGPLDRFLSLPTEKRFDATFLCERFSKILPQTGWTERRQHVSAARPPPQQRS